MSIHYRFSKQAFLQDVPNPVELPDGTKSFQDFMGSRCNRFQNPEAAAKNRIQEPAKTLYYWNAPPGYDEDRMTAVSIEGLIRNCIHCLKAIACSLRICQIHGIVAG